MCGVHAHANPCMTRLYQKFSQTYIHFVFNRRVCSFMKSFATIDLALLSFPLLLGAHKCCAHIVGLR